MSFSDKPAGDGVARSTLSDATARTFQGAVFLVAEH